MDWIWKIVAFVIVAPLAFIGLILMMALYISLGAWIIDWDIWGKVYRKVKRQKVETADVLE